MHNVRRINRTAEQQAARKQKEAVEIRKLKALTTEALDRKSTLPPEQHFKQTTSLLKVNPENYTCWNIRREILNELVKTNPDIIKKELEFTESLLSSHPKIHWIWNHRRWVIKQLDSPSTVMMRELELVNYLLNRDPRNFHGWTYRRWVNSLVPSTTETIKKEFDFTTEKINQNFSNFSAWHHRAEQIKKMEERPLLSSELEYIHQAVGMDPQDQSGWLYYMWLLNGVYEVNTDILEEEMEFVTEILLDEDEAIWPARMVCHLCALMHKDVDPQIIDKLVKLDPMRAQRYKYLVK